MKCAVATGKSISRVISMFIVPMKIQYGDNKKIMTTYAMLDNCSQGCFIHDSMIKKLGIVGINTTLNLKTLHWENLRVQLQ